MSKEPQDNQWEEDLRVEINTRLFYALGDIEPTEMKMTIAVNSISNLIKEEIAKAREEERARVEKKIVQTLNKFANTPIDQRKPGLAWDLLVKLREFLNQ